MSNVINWAALPHCPADQFTNSKPRDTDAGYDIKSAETVIVNPYSRLDFSWETVGFAEDLKVEIPKLFDSNYNEELFYNQGVRFRDKLHVKYIDTDASIRVEDLLKEKLGTYVLETLDLHSCLYGTNRHGAYINQSLAKDIATIEGVIEASIKVVVERKKYKPLLIKTGIVIQPEVLMWNGIYLRSSMTKYGIAQAHSVGIVDAEYDNELFIAVYSLEGITVIKRGERIAQLVSHPMLEGIKLNKVERSNLIKFDRGGFGHSGSDLKVA